MEHIYILKEAAVIGSFAKETFEEEKTECKECNISRPLFTEYIHIGIEFDIWFGEDLILLSNRFFVSERLREGMQKVELKGIEFKEITKSKSKYFQLEEGAYQDDLPKFYYLSPINHKVKVDSPIYISKGNCSTCGKEAFDISDDGFDYIIGEKEIEGEQGVYKKNWGGEDFFYSEQHTEPFITTKFKDILVGFNMRQLTIVEAKWIQES